MTQTLADSSSWLPGDSINRQLLNDYLVRFAGEGLDEVTGGSLSSHPNYICASIISLEHRLFRFSKLTQPQLISS